MKKIKHMIVIFGVVLLANSHFEIHAFERDEIIEYAFKKIEINSEYEQIPWLTPFFIAHNYEEMSFASLSKIEDTYGRFILIKTFLESRNKFVIQNIDRIIEYIFAAQETENKPQLLQQLICFYIASGEKEKTKNSINLLISESRKNPVALVEAYALLKGIQKMGLKQEQKELAFQIRNYLMKNDDLYLLEQILLQGDEINNSIGTNSIVAELKKKYRPNTLHVANLHLTYYSFSKINLILNDYKEAMKYLDLAFRVCQEQEGLSGLIELLNAVKKDDLNTFCNRSPAIMKYINNVHLINKNVNSLEFQQYDGLVKCIISFYIDNSLFDRAYQLASNFDSIYPMSNAKDVYYIYLGFSLKKTYSKNWLEFILSKIQSIENKIHFLSSYILYLRNQCDMQDSESINLNYLKGLLPDPQYLSKLEHINPSKASFSKIAMSNLYLDSPQKALEIIHFEKNNYFKNLVYFEISQYFVFKGETEKALRVVQLTKNRYYRALIYSKIASRELYCNNKKKGIDLFRRAIDLALESNNSNLYEILADYSQVKNSKSLRFSYLWNKEMSK